MAVAISDNIIHVLYIRGRRRGGLARLISKVVKTTGINKLVFCNILNYDLLRFFKNIKSVYRDGINVCLEVEWVE